MSVMDLSAIFPGPCRRTGAVNTVLDYGDEVRRCNATVLPRYWQGRPRCVRGTARRGRYRPGLPHGAGEVDGLVMKGMIRQLSASCGPRDERTPADRSADMVIDVVYDGPDLTEVAGRTGLTMRKSSMRAPRPCGEWDSVGVSGFRIWLRRPCLGCRAGRSADVGAGRLGRPRRRVQRGVSRSVTRRLAAHRRHRRGALADRAPNPALLTRGMWVRSGAG